MSLHMYDGSHRFHAAKRVWHEAGLNLPVTIAVKSLQPDEPDDSTLEEMRALNQRVAVPASLIAVDAKKQLRYAGMLSTIEDCHRPRDSCHASIDSHPACLYRLALEAHQLEALSASATCPAYCSCR